MTHTKKHDNLKPMGCSKSSSKREVYSNTNFKKQEKHWVDNLNLYLKLEKEKQNKTKNRISIRKEVIKIRAEINEKMHEGSNSKYQ